MKIRILTLGVLMAGFVVSGNFDGVSTTGLPIIAVAHAADAKADEVPSGYDLMPYNSNGKWGYLKRDATKVEFVIPPTFEMAHPFAEGRAAVKQNGLWGFIDGSGKLAVQPKYTSIRYQEFRGGRAAVEKDGKYGLIDADGVEILPLKFRKLDLVPASGVAVAAIDNPANPNDWEGLSGLYDYTGRQLMPTEYSSIYPFFKNGITVVEKNKKKALANDKGELLTALEYENVYHSDIDHFIAEVEEGKGQALYDPQGRLLFKNTYPYTGKLSDNRAQFKDGATKLFGYLNEKGEVAIPAQFFLCEGFKEGVAFVRRKVGGSTEVINTAGISLGVIPGGDLTNGFQNGYAWVRDQNDMKYYCYSRGELKKVFEPGFKYAGPFDENGLSIVEVDRNKVGLIDKTGQFVVQPEYFRIEKADALGQYIVTRDDKQAVIDKTGKFIIEFLPLYIESYNDRFYRIMPSAFSLDGNYICMIRSDGVMYFDTRKAG